jgi:hypothetical protein
LSFCISSLSIIHRTAVQLISMSWVSTGPYGGSEQERKKIQEEQNEQHLSVREQILLEKAEKRIQVLRSILNSSFSSGSRTASFHLSVELQILLEKTEKRALEGDLGPSGDLQRLKNTGSSFM